MNTILMDMFIGWKTGTIGRLRFGLYFVFLLFASATAAWFYLTHIYNGLSHFLFWFTTLLGYYCGLLLIIKRYRELTRFPVFFALLHWGIALFASYKALPLLGVVSLVLLLILLVAPGRNARADINDQNDVI